MPGADDVKETIEKYIASFPKRKRIVELGFFGGNFTGIPAEEQEKYLEAAQPYLAAGDIHGIRLSTRPDYIDDKSIKLLKKYNVTTVELGAQSMVEKVLQESGRGHTVEDTVNASKMIKKAGMRLGLQMMIGLPGDKPEFGIQTASDFVKLGADDTRIYPTLVIKGTALEQLYKEEKYTPLEMEEAVSRAADVFRIFEEGGVRVIRMGLHPSDGLLNGDDLIAGPFHEAFRELVMTEIWREEFLPLMRKTKHKKLEIHTTPKQFNFAIGHAAKNKKDLLKFYETVVFYKDENLQNRNYHVYYH